MSKSLQKIFIISSILIFLYLDFGGYQTIAACIFLFLYLEDTKLKVGGLYVVIGFLVLLGALGTSICKEQFLILVGYHTLLICKFS